jgi:hypothetical protein
MTDGLAPEQEVVCPVCYGTFPIRRAGFTLRTSRLAVASLILGILSLLGMCLTGVPAIITGGVALRTIGRSQGALLGRRFALAGIVTGVLFGVLCAPVTAALLVPLVQALRRH